MKRRVFRGLAAVAMIAPSLVLSGCAGDLNPVRDVFVATGIGEGPREAPEFISQSRPAESGYIPIGQTAPPRQTAPKSDDELAVMEDELRSLRDRNTASASQARALAISPAPEPVLVEPPPPLAPSPLPPRL